VAWLGSYQYRKKLTIDSTKISEDLTDFPVLVKLKDGYSDDLTSEGTASAVSYYNANHVPSKAIDDDAETEWAVTEPLSLPTWWKLDFGLFNEKTIQKYTMLARNDSYWEQIPTAWTFQGSNDDSNWDTLDTQSGLNWVQSEKKEFTFSNSTAYRYYRFWITASKNSVNTSFSEIEMMEKDFTFDFDKALSTGYDIRFTADDEITELDFERESHIKDIVDYGVDVCTGGTATASSQNGAEGPANAFDDSSSSFWTSSLGASLPQWLKYDLGSGNSRIARKFTLMARTADPNGKPSNFKLQGSNDDSNWDDLHTVTGETWSTDGPKEYTFSNSTAYRYYRLYITSTSGGTYVQVRELEIMEIIDPYDEGNYWVRLPSVPKYNDGACYFPNNASLTAPDSDDWAWGTGKFTVDFWVKFIDLTLYDCIFSPYDDGGFNRCLFDVGSNNNVRFASTSICDISTPNNSVTTGQWHHIALVRDGANYYIFIDGVSQTLTYTITPDETTNFANINSVFRIGGQYFGWNLNGYIDEFRVSKGVARWTTNFTPPTTEYTSDTNTKLLLHFNSDYTDSGNTGHTITNYSTSLVPGLFSTTDTDFYLYYNKAGDSNGESIADVWGNYSTGETDHSAVWHLKELGDGTSDEFIDSTLNNNHGQGGGGTSSAVPTQINELIYQGQYFDGNDYIQIDDDSTLELADNDFTISMKVYFVNTGGNQCLLGRATSGTSYFYFAKEGTNLRFRDYNSGNIINFSKAWTPTIYTWYDLEVTRNGNDFKIFVDGVQLGTTVTSSATILNRNEGWQIGANTVIGYYSIAIIDEVRIIVGEDKGTGWRDARIESDNVNLISFGAEEEQAVDVEGLESVELSDEYAIEIQRTDSDGFEITDEIVTSLATGQHSSDSFEIPDELTFIERDINILRDEGIKLQEDLNILLTNAPVNEGIQIDDEITARRQRTEEGSEGIEFSDEIEVSKTVTLDFEETIVFGEDYTLVAPEVFEGTESFSIDDEIDAHLIAPVHYATKIISYNPLVIITDTDPIQIVRVDISDPENPTWASYFINLPSETAKNAKDVIFNDTFDLLYIVCEDGQLVQVDSTDYDNREQIDTGDTNDLLKLAQIEDAHRIFMGTDDTDGEIIVLDNFDISTLQTDFRFLEEKVDSVQSILTLTHAQTISTDIRTIATIESTISTDIRFMYVDVGGGTPSNDPYNEVAVYPIARTDFAVYINGSLMSDVQLSSINIRHAVDTDSEASFILARKHDQLDYTIEGTSSQITNQNSVKIYIKGHLEFDGKVGKLECNSEDENVTVTAFAEEKTTNTATKTLPMSSLNQKLHPYQVLLHSPSIYNPYIDPNDENPEYYKGIKIDLGIKTEQRVLRYRTNVDYPAGNSFGFGYNSEGLYSAYPNLKDYIGRNTGFGTSIGKTAIEITNGTFKPRQNWTYFWGAIDANNYIEDREIQAMYVGTSLAVFSMDTWDLLQVRYRYQRILDDVETELGEYTVGEAPFKDIAVKNDVFIPKYRWEDKNNGLYSIKDEGYDYREYAQKIADIEYEKMKHTDGNLFPITTADIELMLDGYYYYNPTLLSRINITNTTTAGIYQNNNGFPTSIKAIEISAKTMKVRLVTDNSLATSELEALDDLYPDEDDYITEAEEIRILYKYDPNRRSNVE